MDFGDRQSVALAAHFNVQVFVNGRLVDGKGYNEPVSYAIHGSVGASNGKKPSGWYVTQDSRHQMLALFPGDVVRVNVSGYMVTRQGGRIYYSNTAAWRI